MISMRKTFKFYYFVNCNFDDSFMILENFTSFWLIQLLNTDICIICEWEIQNNSWVHYDYLAVWMSINKLDLIELEHVFYWSIGTWSSIPSFSITRAFSNIVLASLYLWVSSVANSYIQPNLFWHFLQWTSRTQWSPVNIIRCSTLLEK